MPGTAWCSRGLSGEAIAAPARSWICFDTETGGLDPQRHHITEAAVVVLNDAGTIVTEEVWVEADGDEMKRRWLVATEAWLNGGVLVAHNLRFDLAFVELDRVFGASGLAQPSRWLCTLSSGGRRRSLGALAGALDIDPIDPHTALGDARTLAAVMATLLQKARELEHPTVAGLVLAMPHAPRATRAVVAPDPWSAVVASLDHVAPVPPSTAAQRALLRLLIDPRDPALGLRTPSEIDDAITQLRAAGVCRLGLMRLLQELGAAALALPSWADGTPDLRDLRGP